VAHLAVLRRKRTVAAAVVAAVVAVVAAVVWVGLTPDEVTQPEPPDAYQPLSVPADDPVLAAPEDTDYADVVDVTDEVLPVFSGDLSVVRAQLQGDDAFPYGEPDQCLLDWVSANLQELSARGAYEVMTVCDRPTLVLAGPDGADAKVLVHGAMLDGAPAGARQIIGESTSQRMAFAAVRSADGKAQLMATAELD